MDTSSFKEIESSKKGRGKIFIPVGPQHPALKEPASFKIALSGEKIMEASVRLGYNHRGIEKACEERTYIQDLYLIERICGICSHAHSTCYVQVVEEISAIQIPKRAVYIRTLIAELERIHSHLLWMGVAAHEIGFDTLLMYTWNDREIVMDIMASLTGNRVNYGINTIGGVRRDLTPESIDKVLKAIDVLEQRTKYYIEISMQDSTLIQRLSGVGMLSNKDALSLGAVGPTARASGVDMDIRRDDPYGAYEEIEFKVITDTHCDVYGRMLVRLGELMTVYNIIRQLIAKLPDGPVTVKVPRIIPQGEALGRYEAPRGELMHYIRSNGTEKPDRVKVRTPTLANIQSVAKMLEDRYLADLPIVVAAIDPCFSCTDRTIEVNKKIMSWVDLHKYSIEWYKKRGIDFSKAK